MPLTQEAFGQIVTAIDQSKLGLDKENMKFDFKRQWYNLKERKDIFEFLKDTTSIANTFGPDGYIVIGFDDKTKIYTDSTFRNSQLRDTGDVIDLISKHVVSLFQIDIIDTQIEGNNVSIIHIPPSMDKPHFIRNYVTLDNNGKEKNEENRIFVRKGTTTQRANKYDVDVMYYDRKNILPEYRIATNIDFRKFNSVFYTGTGYQDFEANSILNLSIENLGSRPVNIIKTTFNIHSTDISTEQPAFTAVFDTIHVTVPLSQSNNQIIIKPGEMILAQMSFKVNAAKEIRLRGNSSEISAYLADKEKLLIKDLRYYLANQKSIISNPTTVFI